MKTFGVSFVEELNTLYPQAEIKKSSFVSREGSVHGYHILFPNGFNASIQFGKGHYCSNRSLMGDVLGAVDPEKTYDAEIAGWWQQVGEFIPFSDGSDVRGWQTVENILKWLAIWSKKEYYPTRSQAWAQRFEKEDYHFDSTLTSCSETWRTDPIVAPKFLNKLLKLRIK